MANLVALAEAAVLMADATPATQHALEALLAAVRYADTQARAAHEVATKAEQVVHVWCESVETQLDQMRRDMW